MANDLGIDLNSLKKDFNNNKSKNDDEKIVNRQVVEPK